MCGYFGTCMSVPYVCQRAEEGIGSPETGVVDGNVKAED